MSLSGGEEVFDDCEPLWADSLEKEDFIIG